MKRILIKSVVKGSIAEEMEIEAGDYLISVNQEEIKDILDYKFQIFDEEITLEIEKSFGEVWDLEIEKEENEDLGLVFEEELIDKPRNCANKCIFCFMDQLPPHVRETLVFKDDDFRLSFISGNYVTLTNSGYRDLERIVKYHLSPINISVHSTDPEVRCMMLQNKNAGKIMEYIEYLTSHDISVNAQIVLCPGINDGNILDKTISDLANFYPMISCIAIVPVGLTKYRENLYPLTTYDKDGAKKVVEQVEAWQNKFLKKYGSRIVFCSDEFFIKAGKPLPSYEEYEEFGQLEDGIGLLTYFTKEFDDYLETIEKRPLQRTVSVATGKITYQFIREKADTLEKAFPGLKIHVYAIENTYFGPEIIVTGLITGGDLIRSLQGKELGEYLLLDGKILKEDEDVFLDDVSKTEVEKELNIKIRLNDCHGDDFIKGCIE